MAAAVSRAPSSGTRVVDDGIALAETIEAEFERLGTPVEARAAHSRRLLGHAPRTTAEPRRARDQAPQEGPELGAAAMSGDVRINWDAQPLGEFSDDEIGWRIGVPAPPCALPSP